MRDEKGRFTKGHQPWHKDKIGVYSQDTLDAMSKNNGRHWLGKKRSDLSEKLKRFGVGNKEIYKLRPHDCIPVKKGSQLSERHKKNISKASKGKIFTEETRAKMSLAKRCNPKRSEYYRKIGLKGISVQQANSTSIERIVYDFLLSQGVIFEKQKIINERFIVDIYVPDHNLIIECDGEYWHTLDRVAKKDKAENAYLDKCGFSLIRLTEQEIKNGSFKERLVRIGK